MSVNKLSLGNYTVTVSTDRMYQKASELEALVEKLDSALTQAAEIVKRTDAYWVGDAAKTASDNLESVSDSISREIISVISSKIDDISNYWNDDASIRFIKGLDGINEEIDRIQKNLLSQSEKIKTASRHMKIAEEEAEKIAKTRDTE